MNNAMKILCSLLVAGLVGSAASAQVSMNSVRVAAADSVKLAQFYSKAFGMREVNRIDMGGGNSEVFLNFGATDAEAKANKFPPLVIMHRENDSLKDPIAHVIFTVTDVKAVAAALKSAGGTLTREPFEFGKTGIMIGMATDPVGNAIELIQEAKQ